MNVQSLWRLFLACFSFKINESLMLTNLIINHQLIRLRFKLDVAASFFVSFRQATWRAILPARFDETRAFVLFSLPEVALKRWKASGREKEEWLEIGAITTLNDSRRVCLSSFPVRLIAPFLWRGEREHARKASLSLFASPKLPRFTTET